MVPLTCMLAIRFVSQPNADPDSNVNADYSCCDRYLNAHTDVDTNVNVDADADANADTDANADADANADYPRCDRYPNANADINGNPNADTDINGDPNANADINGDADAYRISWFRLLRSDWRLGGKLCLLPSWTGI